MATLPGLIGNDDVPAADRMASAHLAEVMTCWTDSKPGRTHRASLRRARVCAYACARSLCGSAPTVHRLPYSMQRACIAVGFVSGALKILCASGIAR